ncbi:uncharacterized protein LOC62_06G008226 [Vanrija pseudolonga]|uniref:Purtative membrane protein n=1 Tax=Vanrija pseudolonga TaxID=143232 RepID=A0AAF0YGP6_9TREE|nr:purtative membrane protein [Vanrija pseudolonga]
MPILRSKKPSAASPLPNSPSLAEHALSVAAAPSQSAAPSSPLKESGGPLFPAKSSTTPRLLVTEDWSNDPESPNEINVRTTMSGHPDTEISLTSPTAASEVRYDGRHSRRESLVQRVTDKLNSPANGEEKKRRSRRSRRASTSSAVSQGRTISTALAKGANGGLSAGQAEDVIGKRAVSTGRSPYLIRAAHGDDSDEGYGSEDDSEHESDNEGLDHLPVTGFAVASNRRNAEFHALFPTVDEGDYLIEDYGCALAKDILVHGRLYVSENHICFHSNLFGWVTDVVVPFADVKTIEKKMTALVIPNAIGVVTSKEKYTFASLISRDSTFDVLMNIWRIAHPDDVMAPSVANGASRPPSITDCEAPQAIATHRSTECACGKAGTHYAEVALDAVFPSSPEKVYNLIFNSGWFRTFLYENQKLKDIESSDWRPDEEQRLTRSMSYIKPLNGSVGPKQTKCQIVDYHEHCDFDDYIAMITTTKTPDVPNGSVFSVKTRTCFTWAGPASTRVLRWNGLANRIIERGAIEGQKQFHDDLATQMRAHMKEHPTEFAVAGADHIEEAEVEVVSSPTGTTEAQQYAAEARRARQDRDYWVLQGSLDSVLSGFKSIASGVSTAADAVGDLIGDWPISKGTFMVIIIVGLMLSNIYTYLARPVSQHKVKRLQRLGPNEEDIAEAVRLILAKRAATTPKDEIAELLRLLDEVEARSAKLRSSLEQSSSTLGQSSLEELD